LAPKTKRTNFIAYRAIAEYYGVTFKQLIDGGLRCSFAYSERRNALRQ